MVFAPIPSKPRDHSRFRRKTVNALGSPSKKNIHPQQQAGKTVQAVVSEHDESSTSNQSLDQNQADEDSSISSEAVHSVSRKAHARKKKVDPIIESTPDPPAIPTNNNDLNSLRDTSGELDRKSSVVSTGSYLEILGSNLRAPLPRKNTFTKLKPLPDTAIENRQLQSQRKGISEMLMDEEVQYVDLDSSYKEIRSIGTQTDPFIGHLIRLPKVDANDTVSSNITPSTHLEPIKAISIPKHPPTVVLSPSTKTMNSDPYTYESISADLWGDMRGARAKIHINKDLSKIVADRMTQQLKQLKKL
jgi:hypothetical protein